VPVLTIPGTVDAPAGVSADDHARLGATGRVIVVLLLAACLGFQGERCEVDPALRSPGTALATYWEALMNHDVEAIWACAAGPPGDLPYPGMQWGLPATRAFTIENLRFIPIDEDHVSATYKVRFRPRGNREERSLTVVTDLLRIRGEYRVLHPLSEAGVLESRPVPLRVDS